MIDELIVVGAESIMNILKRLIIWLITLAGLLVAGLALFAPAQLTRLIYYIS